MKNITLALLAATAIAAFSTSAASAMPFSNVPAALGESQVQDVRLVCDRHGRCYNTNRYRYSRGYGQRYYGGYGAYGAYAGPRYGGGYYGGPRVGVGIGPFGF